MENTEPQQNGLRSPTDVTTEDSFHEALKTLLKRADENGIDVRGGWAIVSDTGVGAEWDLEICEVVRERPAH